MSQSSPISKSFNRSSLRTVSPFTERGAERMRNTMMIRNTKTIAQTSEFESQFTWKLIKLIQREKE